MALTAKQLEAKARKAKQDAIARNLQNKAKLDAIARNLQEKARKARKDKIKKGTGSGK